MSGRHPSPSERIIIAASIRWDVPPPHVLATKMRELLSAVYRELLEPEEVQSVAMAAHELLENLLKYSAGASSFEIEICARDGAARVLLCTRNAATPQRADRLKRLVERLAVASDPMLVYDELVASSPRRDGSGLGLARIRAEGDMTLTYSTEDGLVTLVAERPVSIRKAA